MYLILYHDKGSYVLTSPLHDQAVYPEIALVDPGLDHSDTLFIKGWM